VAMDKFRGTASAKELCDTVAEVLKQFDYVPDCQPMSDGGEGFREAFSGEDFAALVEARSAKPSARASRS